MIRNEVYIEGLCIAAEIIDLDDNTITFEENGEIVDSRGLTEEEIISYTSFSVDPKQQLLDRVAEASSVEDIKGLLADVLRAI